MDKVLYLVKILHLCCHLAHDTIVPCSYMTRILTWQWNIISKCPFWSDFICLISNCCCTYWHTNMINMININGVILRQWMMRGLTWITKEYSQSSKDIQWTTFGIYTKRHRFGRRVNLSLPDLPHRLLLGFNKTLFVILEPWFYKLTRSGKLLCCLCCNALVIVYSCFLVFATLNWLFRLPPFYFMKEGRPKD